MGEPNPQDQPEEMEDMSQEYMIDFRVEISKRGDKLRFRFSLLGLYDAAVLKDLYLQVIPSWYNSRDLKTQFASWPSLAESPTQGHWSLSDSIVLQSEHSTHDERDDLYGSFCPAQ